MVELPPRLYDGICFAQLGLHVQCGEFGVRLLAVLIVFVFVRTLVIQEYRIVIIRH